MKGHIRERSLGHWAIILDMRDPATRKRHRKWHSFAGTKRQAQIECARLISEMQRGTYLEPNKTSLTQFLDKWLADVKTRVSPKTYERYEQICHKNIAPVLGAVPLARLRPEQISEAFAKALATGRRKGDGGLSPRTVRQMHAIIKSALAQAVKWELLVRNPAAAVRGPKVSRVAMQTYDLEQTVELIEASRGQRVFIPTLLAVLGGLRRGEIAALRWRHVDLAAAQLAVVQSAEQTKAGVRYKEPKSPAVFDGSLIRPLGSLTRLWCVPGGTPMRRIYSRAASTPKWRASGWATARLGSRWTFTAMSCRTCRPMQPRLLTEP